MEIYLDYAASVPIAEEVWAYVCSLKDAYGNPRCAHAKGREARAIIETARETIANHINAEPCEIIFTSSGTAANNLAIAQSDGHIITTATEHISLLSAVENSGMDYTILPVDMQGTVNTLDIENAICNDTDMISVIHINNELGTINDIATIAEIATVHGALFHADCVATLPHMEIDVKAWGLGMATFSGHKIGGLKGTGVLYVAKHVDIVPIIHGRETENVLGVASFGKAVELLQNTQQLNALCDALEGAILESIPCAVINNPTRITPVLNVRFEGFCGAWLVQALSDKGIYASQGACSNPGASHALRAIGLTREQAQSSVRFSPGKDSTVEDINYVVETLLALLSRIIPNRDYIKARG